MKNDYETGLQRGRGSRHGIGRIRWFLLAVFIFNIFLFYKLWTQNAELTNIRIRNDEMREAIDQTNLKKAKAEKINSEIQMEKNKCEKKLSEEKGFSAKIQSEKEVQQRDLDNVRSEMKELSANYEKLTKEKETVDADHERCIAELAATKETIEQLHSKIEELEKSLTGTTPGDKGDKPVVNDIGTEGNKDKPPADDNKDEEIHDADAPAPLTLAQCQFKETKDDENLQCKYHDDLSSTGKWKIGTSDEINTKLKDEQKDSYLFIDDKILAPNIPAGIILDNVQTNQCIKMDITTFATGSGAIKIENHGEMFELAAATEGETEFTWRKNTFNFKKNEKSSHNIKITGSIAEKGAFAISELSIVEEECKEKKEDEEDDSITEEERKDISEIVR